MPVAAGRRLSQRKPGFYSNLTGDGDGDDDIDMPPEGKQKSKDGIVMVKGPWTEEEDGKVVELVSKYGAKRWSLIASHLQGRIGKQCRERWSVDCGRWSGGNRRAE